MQIVMNNSAFVRSYTIEYLKLVHIAFSVSDDWCKIVTQLPMFSPTHLAIALIVY